MCRLFSGKNLVFSITVLILSLQVVSAQSVDSNFSPDSDLNHPTDFTVVLDAGHGGKDHGAAGSFSLEKNVTLAIVLKLGHILEETQPDIRVVYTRTTDTYPELYERTALANKVHADLFISIHCNSSPYHRIRVGWRRVKRHGKIHRYPIYRITHTTTARGVETYVMGLKRNNEKERAVQGSMEAADSDDVEARENSYIVHEKNYQENYHGFDPTKPETYILLALRTSAYLNQSIAFADSVQHQFLSVGRPSRDVKQGSLAVLAGTAMPAVLIETGFIDNPGDERYLNSQSGQEQTAECIARAIVQYKDAVLRYRALRKPNNTNSTITNMADNAGPKAPHPVVYKIQLLVSNKHYTTSSQIFKNIYTRISIEDTMLDNDKVYRYVTGRYYSRDAADNALENIQQIGFKDAFIVPYQDGERLAN
jgi:N-acetylmuramoyl-L-alanine amidase